MTVPDISAATTALQNLLVLNVARLSGSVVNVSTLRPERVDTGNILNLYCYHVTEDTHTKLRRRQSQGQAIATSPLSLVLHYIVTAHIDTTGSFDALTEQRLLSYAMKTFHDFPVIEDGVLVGADSVMPLELQGRDNRFEITMVQLNPLESLEFWANEHDITAKPSAYYEVRPVELEPEAPTRVPGVVLTLGNFVFLLGTPQIAGTEGELPLALPAALGGGTTTATLSPARVGPVNPAPLPAWNILRLKGAALDKGQAQTLLLSHPHWTLLFPDLSRIPVEMAQNAALGWSQTVADGLAEISVGEQLAVPRPDGSFTTVDLYPGTYTVSWAVRLAFEQSDGSTRFIEERSNDATFSVNPRITGFARDGASGAVTLDFGGPWRLNRGIPPPPDPVAEPELDILLSVDGTGYRRWNDVPPVQPPGTYTLADHQLSYLPLAAANATGLHTVRVLVNGADTQPFWIEIP